ETVLELGARDGCSTQRLNVQDCVHGFAEPWILGDTLPVKPYRWTTHGEAVRAEREHWRNVSIADRVSAVETIREATIGIYDEAPARMERTYRFIALPPRPLPRGGGARAGAAHGRPRATQD